MTERIDPKDRKYLRTDGQKERFIRQLAHCLVHNQTSKSVALQIEANNARVQWAREWSELRGMSPVRGYPTVDEAYVALEEFLNG